MSTYGEFLKITRVKPDDPFCVPSFIPWDAKLVGDTEENNLHGGLITSLLDQVCGHGAGMASQGMVATLDLRIDYMRPSTPHKNLFAEAVCLKQTHSAVFMRGLAHQGNEDKPIATATGVFFKTAPNSPWVAKDASSREKLAEMESIQLPVRDAKAPDYNFSGEANAHLAKIPFAQMLGVKAFNLGGQLTCVLPYKQELIGNPILPALHGGAVGAFLETASLLELTHIRKLDQPPPKPISVTLDYLRSGKAVDTFAAVHVLRVGRRIANVRAHAWQEDIAKPIVTFHASFLLPSNLTNEPDSQQQAKS